MNSTMTLTGPNYKGQQVVNGTANKFSDGLVTVGGVLSKDSVNDDLYAKFGYLVSCLPAVGYDFFLGVPSSKSTAVVAGVILADQSILDGAPAKSDYYYANSPIPVVKRGILTYRSWDEDATDYAAPTLSSVVAFSITTGQITFLASGTTSETGYVIVSTAKVAHVDPETGSVFVSFNFI